MGALGIIAGIAFIGLIAKAVGGTKRVTLTLGPGRVRKLGEKEPPTTKETVIHAGKTVPQEVADTVDLLAAKKATADAVESAAALAEAAGFPEQAAALHKAASNLPQVQKKLESPLPNVNDATWGKFAGKMKQGELGTVTAAAHLGLFLISFRRLKDLGLVENVRKVKFVTPTSGKDNMAYVGDFIAPLTREKFLSDAAIQYATFVKNIKNYYAKILTSHAKEIGKEHDGKKATLSGLLAVAVAAGSSGMADWLKGNKMPYTSKFYQRVNGIF
jgi:hypothetical protein